VGCETDFVARTEDFKKLAKNLAMQVAAMKPVYVSRESVPEDVISKEKEIYKAQIPRGKPDHVVEKILEGKLEKFYEENCLLDQVYIKDEEGKSRVKDYIAETIAKVGENITVKRFTRYELGE
ncbi:MAG TPA: elongation factor Ts, partial [Candidatus Atribacteria bacterium]|nr:elongation factor Ts [Candidatus Atribacteria bacterium]